LAGCQPPPAPTAPAAATDDSTTGQPAPDTRSSATDTTSAAPALPCGVVGQRNWQAQTSAGSSGSLTIAGEIDLGAPGYGVSLARDDAEAQGAATTTLTLRLRPPSGVTPQVVTPHQVRYFGPATGPYETVRIVCDGALLTTITTSR
jgi:hypothetical protein